MQPNSGLRKCHPHNPANAKFRCSSCAGVAGIQRCYLPSAFIHQPYATTVIVDGGAENDQLGVRNGSVHHHTNKSISSFFGRGVVVLIVLDRAHRHNSRWGFLYLLFRLDFNCDTWMYCRYRNTADVRYPGRPERFPTFA